MESYLIPELKQIYLTLLMHRMMGRERQAKVVLRNPEENSNSEYRNEVGFFYLLLNNKALFLAVDVHC